jgi:hypothetical protein
MTLGGMHSNFCWIAPKIPPNPVSLENSVQKNQTIKQLQPRLFGAGAKSNPDPEFGFEVANEGSVAYASIAK